MATSVGVFRCGDPLNLLDFTLAVCREQAMSAIYLSRLFYYIYSQKQIMPAQLWFQRECTACL